MLLSEIVKNYPEAESFGEAEIESLSSSSKKVVEGALFFCMERDDAKMRKYVDESVARGAKAVVVCKKTDKNVPQIVVNDLRRAYSYLSAAFYGDPQKRLKIIGVVGTNGKTTTCRLVADILNRNGRPCGNVGTLGAFYNGKKRELDLTTPDPEDFFALLKEMADDGVEYVVTEYSAHAIYYKKLDCVFFEALVFTNCTQDHLDFFRTMESYSAVKTEVFRGDGCRFKIVNSDDVYGRQIINADPENVIAYGIKSPADVFALKIRLKSNGCGFFVNAFDDVEQVFIRLLGTFNVYNSLAAISVAHALGISLRRSAAAISGTEAIEGRLEYVGEHNGAKVYIDYAHTPDGLENALLTLGKITRNSLILVFGCGGNRDKEKRPVMGKVAGDIADFVIVTEDNSRYEDPDRIIADIESGLREATRDFIAIKDRREAIKYALKRLVEGDVLLVAGRGAEKYQEIMGVKTEFEDKAVLAELMKK